MKYNFFLAEIDGKTAVRYYQVGIDNGDGFTGLVRDYVGGGEFGTFYFIDGEPAEEAAEDEDPDDDELEQLIDDRYPGIIEKIYAFLEEHVEEDDADESHVVLPSPELLGRFSDPGNEVVGNYDGIIEVGNTTFPDA